MSDTQTPPAARATGSSGDLTAAGLVAVLVGAALAPIDLFVVNVALPAVQTDLQASPAALEWVVTAYGLGFALFLVVGGRLGDAFGRRRLFVAGLAGFTVTSLACGLAPAAAVLVGARAAQGISAAMLVPQVLSIIQAATTGERRARALGWYGATGGIAMVVGQLLGGVLVSADLAGTSWRPVFLINVPIGALAIVLALRCLPESRSSHPLGVDRWGTALLGVTLLALLVPLMEGQSLGRPIWCWVSLAIVPLAITGFVVVESRLERGGTAVPLLPPSTMRLSSMRTGLSCAAPFFLTFGGFLFVYAIVLQDGLHLSALSTGVALTPLGGAMLLLSLAAGRLVSRFGRWVVTTGAVLLIAGLLVLMLTVLHTWPDLGLPGLAPGTILFGLGLGLVSPTLFRIVLSRVPAETAGVGSGVLATTQQVSVALGVATLGTLFTTLRPPEELGTERALVITLAVAAVVAAVIAMLSPRLPDPRT